MLKSLGYKIYELLCLIQSVQWLWSLLGAIVIGGILAIVEAPVWAIIGISIATACLIVGIWLAIDNYSATHRHSNLALTFRPEEGKPYLEIQLVQPPTFGPFEDRRFRVGICNPTQNIIRDARVVLESAVPGHNAIHPEHALQVMGQPSGSEMFNVYPSDRPTAFVDVVYEQIPNDRITDDVYIAYAASISNRMDRTNRLQTLRVEGAATPHREVFVVEEDSITQRMSMRRATEKEIKDHRLAL